MLTFLYTITDVLNQYKALLRKEFGRAEASKRIRELGITRYQLQNIGAVDLYRTAKKIIIEIEGSITGNKSRDGGYFGLVNFLHHLREVLSDFELEGGDVIHKTRAASKAIVDIIQWTSFEDLSYECKLKIDDAVNFVARRGSKDQRKHLKEILEKKTLDHPYLCQVLSEYRLKLLRSN